MKTARAAILVIAASLVCSPAVMLAQDSLTNDAILKMVKAGLGEDLIVNMIQSQPGKFTTTPEEISRLKQAGVSEKILTAMVKKGSNAKETPSGGVKIEARTPVRLTVEQTISSGSAKTGDTLKLAAAEDVLVGGRIVIAKGASAAGRVVAVEKRARATRDGKLEIVVDSVQAIDGHNIALDCRMTFGGASVFFPHMGSETQLEKGKEIPAVTAAEAEVKLQRP